MKYNLLVFYNINLILIEIIDKFLMFVHLLYYEVFYMNVNVQF